MKELSHDRISPTAKFVAHLRTFSDIPHSNEIALACDAESEFMRLTKGKPQDFLWLAPMIEMRYKSVDAVLNIYQPTNIVELAAGVSPRGLIRSEDDCCNFIETDLPDILVEKHQTVRDILGSRLRNNLHRVAVNAVEDEELFPVGELLIDGPTVVLNEGLLPYLSIEEKGKVARNVYQFLKRKGGIWITPDVTSKDRMAALSSGANPRILQAIELLSGQTGRDFIENSFDSFEVAKDFFEGFGFKVSVRSQRDLVPHLTSLGISDGDPDLVNAMLERGKIWIMEV